MEILYVLMNCDIGSESEIINELVAIPEVKEVRGTYGVYDIFVKLEGESKEKLVEILTKKIRILPKIRTTLSLSPILSQGGR